MSYFVTTLKQENFDGSMLCLPENVLNVLFDICQIMSIFAITK